MTNENSLDQMRSGQAVFGHGRVAQQQGEDIDASVSTQFYPESSRPLGRRICVEINARNQNATVWLNVRDASRLAASLALSIGAAHEASRKSGPENG